MQDSKKSESTHVLIVGSGCFGLSTAFHLLHETQVGTTQSSAPRSEPGAQALGSSARYEVTVIDASPIVPAPDAASSDINKVVRTSYSDPFYAQLAKDAIDLWKEGTICGSDTYHESGVLVLGLQDADLSFNGQVYANKSFQNDVNLGAKLTPFSTAKEVRSVLPDAVEVGTLFEAGKGYHNANGGWAAASKAMNALLENVRKLGARVEGGLKMTGLLLDNEGPQKVKGVQLENGESIEADLVVLAMGAWTPSVLSEIPDIDVNWNDCLVATGQTLATVKLDSDMSLRYHKLPVLLDWSTGFYMFPPNEENVIKLAIHNEGYKNVQSDTGLTVENPGHTSSLKNVSPPRTTRTHGAAGMQIPSEAVQALHQHLDSAYPELAKLPFETTRICWYMDTPDEDWIIDVIPSHSNLFIATGGSGHAFKFLPIIGRLVKDRIRGNLQESVAAKFSLSRNFISQHGSRQGRTKILEESSLWGAVDFNRWQQNGDNRE